MPLWKLLLLGAYYYGTSHLRRCWCARMEKQGTAPIVALYFHRVADDVVNPWTVSNAMFQQQVDCMRRSFEIITLEETQRRLRTGRNERLAVHISFDDGYASNSEHALPMLVREKIPFSYFVNSTNVLQQTPFPHDVARHKPLPPNTVDQIKFLADAGVEIGSHTRTHCNLGQIHDAARLHEEVIGCKDDLEMMTGQPVRYFAFPFGLHQHLNREVFHLCQRQGLAGVCSAYGGYNFPGADPFHIHRFDGSPIFLQFRNWLLYDPLKELRVRRYDYEPARAAINAADTPATSATHISNGGSS